MYKLKFSTWHNRISKFTGNVLKLSGGTAIGQGLVIIATPLITRLYSQEEMGIIGVFLAFINFVSVGLGLRYEIAIVSAKTEEEANILLLASIFFTLPMSVIAGFGMWVMIWSDLISYGTLPYWCSVAATIALIFRGIFSPLYYWHARRSNFGDVSRALIAQGCGRAIIPISLGLGHVGWVGLLCGEIVGRALGILRLLRSAIPAIIKTFAHLDVGYLRSILFENWKYPLVVLPSSLLDSLAAMLPLPILAFLFGPAAAGQFFLVQRLSQLPARLISASVGDVFFSHLSDASRKDHGNVRTILLSVAKKLSIISGAVYIPVALIAPFIFGVLFGENWAKTGLLLSVLTPISLVGLVVSPISRVLFVVNRTELKLIIDFIRIIVPISSLWVMYSLGYGFFYSIAVFSFLSTLNYMLYFWLVYYASGLRIISKYS